MLNIPNTIEEFAAPPGAFPVDLAGVTTPRVLRGLAADWPLVKAATVSTTVALDYLYSFYRGASIGALFGKAEDNGRIFYNEDMSGFNFRRVMTKLDTVLDEIARTASMSPTPGIYVGSTTVDTCLPGFRELNDIDFGALRPLASLWLGNRTRIAAHYDLPDNLACNVLGTRRFILFPPHALANLYVGPLDLTPAGQAISLVDFHHPDPARYPRFEAALRDAQVAELAPGDAIYIPSMWWHHVEALASCNALVNYWWRQSPRYMGPPIEILLQALLSIRDLPAEQRRAWQGIFEHYVFSADDDTTAHIPADKRGVLAPMDETRARELRARLLNMLNR